MGLLKHIRHVGEHILHNTYGIRCILGIIHMAYVRDVRYVTYSFRR